MPFVLEAARHDDALVLAPSLATAGFLAARLRRLGVAVAELPRDWPGRRPAGAWRSAPAPRPGPAAPAGGGAGARRGRRGLPGGAGPDVERPGRRRRAGPPGRRAVRAGVAGTVAGVAGDPRCGAAHSRPQRRAGGLAGGRCRRPPIRPPGAGLYSSRVVDLLRQAGPGRRVVCVLNRKGRARLLACAACGELARCEVCEGPVAETGSPAARVRSPGAPLAGRFRPILGRYRRSKVERRAGVPALRRGAAGGVHELRCHPAEDAAGRRFPGTGGAGAAGRAAGGGGHRRQRWPAARHAGAGGHRGGAAPGGGRPRRGLPRLRPGASRSPLPRRRAGPRHARPGRPAGRRSGWQGGRIWSRPACPTTRSSTPPSTPTRRGSRWWSRPAGRPSSSRRRRRWPSCRRGRARLRRSADGVEIVGPSDGRWLLRAPDHATLADALAATPRPSGRMRVEVDPRRT